jgi:hypothetical protein
MAAAALRWTLVWMPLRMASKKQKKTALLMPLDRARAPMPA